MNIFQLLSRKIIKLSFDFSVHTIERYSDMHKYEKQVEELKLLEKGTLGREIANCLEEHNLKLVPKFESHDLKHVLLDYKMTPEDEIRMQAFMIGNGNYSVVSFAIFFFGVLLLPDLWRTFLTDFRKGRDTQPISSWTIEQFGNKNLSSLQEELSNTKIKKTNPFNMKRITQFMAISSVLAGVFGMIYCLPFLFSSNLADLIGAGFPFIGGAILVIGGLLTLSNLVRIRAENTSNVN